jgi:effector-binding domain-containing protein
MNTKQTSPKKIFYHATTTTLDQINKVAMEVIEDMYHEAKNLGLEEEEPMHFIYTGMSDDLTQPFHLEIALVVKNPKEGISKYKFRELEPIRVFNSEYKGGLQDIGQHYEKMMKEMSVKGFIPTNECREVYHHYEKFDSPNNITEIQLGIH